MSTAHSWYRRRARHVLLAVLQHPVKGSVTIITEHCESVVSSIHVKALQKESRRTDMRHYNVCLTILPTEDRAYTSYTPLHNWSGAITYHINQLR